MMESVTYVWYTGIVHRVVWPSVWRSVHLTV